ncbi:nucleotidyltransferase substrate binding protein [Marivirga harenae]|uniref:nucleotidyltransferase substrate binding protein n=1 Tax=Marivirga harenae TaxID=2010992 RepID=UPI0026DEAE69|nr:nucleotidyltransferase substrate binding protein [Marivirga harenae]WKV11941.1 nucleotidyltransferase substrate binding protein [Marivirga harenae]|tara:strand:- start:35452 stop:35856 length:405 start_codon:yes stop_codon:yes gene_type:complete
MKEDIRWKQRFSNFEKALSQLQEGIENNGADPINIIKEGIVQRFEFTHELAWKVLKDYLLYEGIQNVTGSRSATREAFRIGLISDGQKWMEMIESRNNTVHTYNENILKVEYDKIINQYFSLFIDFQTKVKSLL